MSTDNQEPSADQASSAKKKPSAKQQHSAHQKLKVAKRWVIKIGSALVTNQGMGLNESHFSGWAAQIAQLKASGKEVILVSSGAVAEGVARMGWPKRPVRLPELQAAAAIGQMGLIQAYENQFQKFGLRTAQVLLTHDDLSDRQRYLNARATIMALLKMGVIPVINENDTVLTDEIKFGDNDTLAALVANLAEAQLLVILTDQLGMYTADPRSNPEAKLLSEVQVDDPKLFGMASGSESGLGRGGMTTKVQAAQLASRSGAYTLIASGSLPNILVEVSSGAREGTLFISGEEPMAARKRWIASHLKPQGALNLDVGAVQAIAEKGRSLLAVGITRVSGDFARGAMVYCLSENGEKVACGLVNYASSEIKKIAGQPSDQINSLLGYEGEESQEGEEGEETLIHRNNLVLLQ